MAAENEIKEQPTLMGGLKGIGFAIIILGVAYYFYTAGSRSEVRLEKAHQP